MLKVFSVTPELWASLVLLVHRVTEDHPALRDSKALLDRVDLMELLDHQVHAVPLELLEIPDLRAVKDKGDQRAHWEIRELLDQLALEVRWVRLETEDRQARQGTLEVPAVLDSVVNKVRPVILEFQA